MRGPIKRCGQTFELADRCAPGTFAFASQTLAGQFCSRGEIGPALAVFGKLAFHTIWVANTRVVLTGAATACRTAHAGGGQAHQNVLQRNLL